MQNESYLASRRDIGLLYTRAVRTWKPLCESTTRVLLQYIVNPPANAAIWDNTRLAAVLGEYRFTLSFGELAVLRMLVGGWMLCCAQDLAVKTAVAEEFRALPCAVPYPGDNTEAGLARFGKQILSYLLHNEDARLRPVIYRTEGTRLALESVRGIL